MKRAGPGQRGASAGPKRGGCRSTRHPYYSPACSEPVGSNFGTVRGKERSVERYKAAWSQGISLLSGKRVDCYSLVNSASVVCDINKYLVDKLVCRRSLDKIANQVTTYSLCCRFLYRCSLSCGTKRSAPKRSMTDKSITDSCSRCSTHVPLLCDRSMQLRFLRAF